MKTNTWLEMISDAWEEAYKHSNTVEQLLYEYERSNDAGAETIARINEASAQYHDAMGRYKKASSELRGVLAEQLN